MFLVQNDKKISKSNRLISVLYSLFVVCLLFQVRTRVKKNLEIQSFQCWKYKINALKAKKLKFKQIISKMKHKHLSSCFDQWCSKVEERVFGRHFINKMIHKHTIQKSQMETKSCLTRFHQWKIFSDKIMLSELSITARMLEMERRRSIIHVFFTRLTNRLIGAAVLTWKKNVTE